MDEISFIYLLNKMFTFFHCLESQKTTFIKSVFIAFKSKKESDLARNFITKEVNLTFPLKMINYELLYLVMLVSSIPAIEKKNHKV